MSRLFKLMLLSSLVVFLTGCSNKKLFDYYGKVYVEDCLGNELTKDKLYTCTRKWECIENTKNVDIVLEADSKIRNNNGSIEINKSYFEEVNKLDNYNCKNLEDIK